MEAGRSFPVPFFFFCFLSGLFGKRVRTVGGGVWGKDVRVTSGAFSSWPTDGRTRHSMQCCASLGKG